MGMMMGLRVAVGRQENPLERQELTVQDFYQVPVVASHVVYVCGTNTH